MSTVMQRIFCCFRPADSRKLRESSTSHSGARIHPFHQTSGFSNIDTTTTPSPPKKLAKINSMYGTNDLVISEFKSNNFKELRYNCPICFCYFNSSYIINLCPKNYLEILETSCCANYICHGCSDALNHRVLVNTRINAVACPFCSNEEFTISDVDPKQKVREYTDTPMRSTPRENVFSQFKDLIEYKFSRFSGNKPPGGAKEEKESQVVEIGFSSDGFNNFKNLKEKPSRPLTSETPMKTSVVLHQLSPKRKTPKIQPIEGVNLSTASVVDNPSSIQASHRQT